MSDLKKTKELCQHANGAAFMKVSTERHRGMDVAVAVCVNCGERRIVWENGTIKKY